MMNWRLETLKVNDRFCICCLSSSIGRVAGEWLGVCDCLWAVRYGTEPRCWHKGIMRPDNSQANDLHGQSRATSDDDVVARICVLCETSVTVSALGASPGKRRFGAAALPKPHYTSGTCHGASGSPIDKKNYGPPPLHPFLPWLSTSCGVGGVNHDPPDPAHDNTYAPIARTP